MCELVPPELLELHTWRDLERRVCGEPFIDVALLRRKTQYSPQLLSTAQHVQWFWEVLEEFSQEDRRKFIKFAWAQVRPSAPNGGRE